jgi:hypothetical protein
VLAYLREEKLKCSGCGCPRDETMDLENEGAYSSEPLICHGCRSREKAEEAFRKGNGDTAGAIFITEKKRR